MNYQKLYDSIVTRAKSRELQGFKERHHIVPKCMGGDDSSDNIAELTAKEHFLCHKLLVFIHPSNIGLWHAYNMMSVNGIGQQRNVRLTSREYEEIRKTLLPSMRARALAMVAKRDNKALGRKIRALRLKDGLAPPYKGIKVQQINADGEVVGVYDSTLKAIKATGIKTIAMALGTDSRQKTAGGYTWKQIKD